VVAKLKGLLEAGSWNLTPQFEAADPDAVVKNFL
jgi:hypothetical protein